MTQKTYTAKTCISVNVSLDEYISATIQFEPQINGSSKFVTTDEKIQQGLEANSNYGKLFKLTDTKTVSDSITEPKVSRTNKEEYTTIPEETNARKKADAQIIAQSVSDVNFDTTTNYVRFFNANGEVIANLDATPFVVDGMIDDVEVEDGNLVITFNTDSGKLPISIPLTTIFDPDNYYTKSEINAALLLKQDVINDLQTIREGAAAGALAAPQSTTYNKSEVDGKEDWLSLLAMLSVGMAQSSDVTTTVVTSPEWKTVIVDDDYKILAGVKADMKAYVFIDKEDLADFILANI